MKYKILLTAIILLAAECSYASRSIEKTNTYKTYSADFLLGAFVYSEKLKNKDYKLTPKPQLIGAFSLNCNIYNDIDLFAQFSNQFRTKSTGHYNFNDARYDVINHYRTSSVLFGSKYYLPLMNKLQTYFKLGIGVTMNRSRETHSSNGATAKFQDHTTNHFAYLLGLGLSRSIFSQISWLLEYNYFHGGRAKTSSYTYALDGATTQIPDGARSYKIKNHYILTGVSYKF